MSKNKKIIIGVVVGIIVVCVVGCIISQVIMRNALTNAVDQINTTAATYANKAYPQTNVMVYDLDFDDKRTVEYTIKSVVYDYEPVAYDTESYGDFAKEEDTIVKLVVELKNVSTSSQKVASYDLDLKHGVLGRMTSANSYMLASKVSGDDLFITDGLDIPAGQTVVRAFYYKVPGRGIMAITKDFTVATYDSSAKLVID